LEPTLFEFEMFAVLQILAQSQMKYKLLIPGREHHEHRNLF